MRAKIIEYEKQVQQKKKEGFEKRDKEIQKLIDQRKSKPWPFPP